jgi:HD-GYP domain-containing protein (c-di-GMP phosphodiesterase class II)
MAIDWNQLWEVCRLTCGITQPLKIWQAANVCNMNEQEFRTVLARDGCPEEWRFVPEDDGLWPVRTSSLGFKPDVARDTLMRRLIAEAREKTGLPPGPSCADCGNVLTAEERIRSATRIRQGDRPAELCGNCEWRRFTDEGGHLRVQERLAAIGQWVEPECVKPANASGTHNAFMGTAMWVLARHDPIWAGRSERVAILTVGLAKSADETFTGPYADWHAAPGQLDAIRYAALLADVGIIGVNRELFEKTALSPEEQTRIRNHVDLTVQILSTVPWKGAYARIPDIVASHHEALDGSGYPRGLKAAQIPVESRMLSIANTFDALVALDRPNKKIVSPENGLSILREEARSGRLDPALVGLFVASNTAKRVGTLLPAKFSS